MEKKFNNIINYLIVLAIVFFIIGFVSMWMPNIEIKTLSYLISVLLIVMGAFLVIYTINRIHLMSFLSFGVLQIILGFLILFYPSALNTLLPIALGIWMILKSTIDFRISLLLKKIKKSDWIYVAFLSALSIICGIMLMIKTEIGTIELTVILGVFLAAYSLSSFIDCMVFKENIKAIAKEFDI